MGHMQDDVGVYSGWAAHEENDATTSRSGNISSKGGDVRGHGPHHRWCTQMQGVACGTVASGGSLEHTWWHHRLGHAMQVLDVVGVHRVCVHRMGFVCGGA